MIQYVGDDDPSHKKSLYDVMVKPVFSKACSCAETRFVENSSRRQPEYPTNPRSPPVGFPPIQALFSTGRHFFFTTSLFKQLHPNSFLSHFFLLPSAAGQMNTTTHLQQGWTCVDFYHSLLAGLAALILPCVHFYPCLLFSTPVWLNLNTIGELLLLCSSKKTVQGHLFNFFQSFESM